jgi:mannose-6-phosphate isomerase
MYPLKFKPVLKETLWGGQKICRLKEINILNKTGESWEISGVEGSVSVVSNGPLAGKTLSEIIDMYGEDLLGKGATERFGKQFPLLVKFIDARKTLSIQVHPDDKLAWERHNSSGKTEMWYVIQAEPGAHIYSGFSRQITPEIYLRSVANGKITDYLQRHDVSAGDVFFIPAGRVHAICAGCLIAEIQQTSDITYRIYDYNRRDAGGNLRQLHVELAKDAIDYSLHDDLKTVYIPVKNTVQTILECPYFTVQAIEAEAGEILNPGHINDTFYIYICIHGLTVLTDRRGNTTPLRHGETALIPATAGIEEIWFMEEGRMLIAYIPKNFEKNSI